jgi:hypothetical protein
MCTTGLSDGNRDLMVGLMADACFERLEHFISQVMCRVTALHHTALHYTVQHGSSFILSLSRDFSLPNSHFLHNLDA